MQHKHWICYVTVHHAEVPLIHSSAACTVLMMYNVLILCSMSECCFVSCCLLYVHAFGLYHSDSSSFCADVQRSLNNQNK